MVLTAVTYPSGTPASTTVASLRGDLDAAAEAPLWSMDAAEAGTTPTAHGKLKFIRRT